MIILTPVYIKPDDKNFRKREPYLRESIESVRMQKSDLLHVIIDDGSPPDSLQEIKEEYSDRRTIFLRRERQPRNLLTCTNALNYGLDYIFSKKEISSEEQVSFLHSDDRIINVRSRIKRMVDENSRFLYSDAVIFFDDSPEEIIWEGMRDVKKGRIQNFWIQGKLPYPTMTWTKGLLSEIKDYVYSRYGKTTLLDPCVGCGEDVDMALSTIEYLNHKGEEYSYLSEITAGYRIHSNSLAGIRNQKIRKKEENSVLVKHFGRKMLFPLHLQRFIYRPEEYIPFLFPQALKKRKKVKLEEFF